MGGLPEGLLPTFLYACDYQPTFLRLYLQHLLAWGLPVTESQIDGHFQRYSGDITALGKGEILVYDQP
jgi:formylmethanofuran dehydrogenase subunit C